MMDTHRDILFQKLLVILHRSLVQARNLAPGGNGQQIYDLADTFEILPELMRRWQDNDLDRVRAILADYQARYPGTGYDYLAILDMDETEFRMLYATPQEATVD